jgi:hypothetical protein
MSTTPVETTAGQPPATPKWSRRRRATVVTVIVACAVVAGLFLPTFLGGWAPIVHFACRTTGPPVKSAYAWIPALLLNSPFGGEAFGNGTVLPGPLSMLGFGTVYGLGEKNGDAAWAGFRAEINVSAESNVTLWGPGQDSRCAGPYQVAIQYWGGGVLGGLLLGEGNVSDESEPTSLGHWTYPGDINVTIANGYKVSTSREISTCGATAAQNYTSSTYLRVIVPVTVGGVAYSLPYVLPIEEGFHYLFPAKFGTWQVDNLSAPGGPGGGWAFSYSPCP